MTSTSPESMIALVEQSPKAVKEQNKAAWLALFADKAIIEDPVGSRTHISGVYNSQSGQRDNAVVQRFYDSFIAPNNISFTVHNDIVNGNHVMRDVTIHVGMSASISVDAPMFLIYEVTNRNDAQLADNQANLAISHLQAHWQMMGMITQLFTKGLSVLPVFARMTVNLLKHQGLGGMLAFFKAALVNVGSQGKAQVLNFAAAVNANAADELARCLDDKTTRIHMPYGTQPLPVSEWLEQAAGIQLTIDEDKLIVSGDIVAARITVTKPNEEPVSGVGFFEVNSKRLRIARIRLYL